GRSSLMFTAGRRSLPANQQNDGFGDPCVLDRGEEEHAIPVGADRAGERRVLTWLGAKPAANEQLARLGKQAMEHREASSLRCLPAVVRYGIAVLSVAIAAGSALLLVHVGVRLTPFLMAVGATVWYAGTGPGVLAIILSVLALDYLFVPPVYS